MKSKTLELIRENIGHYLCDLWEKVREISWDTNHKYESRIVVAKGWGDERLV